MRGGHVLRAPVLDELHQLADVYGIVVAELFAEEPELTAGHRDARLVQRPRELHAREDAIPPAIVAAEDVGLSCIMEPQINEHHAPVLCTGTL